MTDNIKFISADNAVRRFHVSVDQLQILADEGKIPHRRLGDKNGYTLYVGEKAVSGMFPKRSTREKLKDAGPPAIVGGAAALLFGEIKSAAKALSDALSDDDDDTTQKDMVKSRFYKVQNLGEFLQNNNVTWAEFSLRVALNQSVLENVSLGRGGSYQSAMKIYSAVSTIASENNKDFGYVRVIELSK